MLLRWWEEESDDPPSRTIRLRGETTDGMRREFASPDALAAYLNDIFAAMGSDADAGEMNGPSS
jgi:hypothetical protein